MSVRPPTSLSGSAPSTRVSSPICSTRSIQSRRSCTTIGMHPSSQVWLLPTVYAKRGERSQGQGMRNRAWQRLARTGDSLLRQPLPAREQVEMDAELIQDLHHRVVDELFNRR